MPAPETAPACPTKKRFVEEIEQALGRVFVLQRDELDAVINYDLSRLEQIRGELKKARDEKGELLDAFDLHVRRHQC